MPLQTEVNKEDTQNIQGGVIQLNLQEVHSGWVKYTADTFDEMHSVIECEPVTDIEIKNFECTSTQVLNSVINDITRSINDNPVPFAL